MKNIYDDEEFFQAYAQMERSEKGLQGAGEWHQFCRFFPEMKGKKVLDLGCGYGWHCAYAVRKGAAEVRGIDSSRRMIEEAQKRNSDNRIQYQVCGAEDYSYPANEYDIVLSNLVLHYIQDLNGIYQKVYHTLKPGGKFLFNIEHPVCTGSVGQEWIRDDKGNVLYWPVDDYFYPGERKTNFLGKDVIKQHHTLTQILGGLLENGFVIEALEEAMPDPAMIDIPGMKDEMRRPMMLLVGAAKL